MNTLVYLLCMRYPQKREQIHDHGMLHAAIPTLIDVFLATEKGKSNATAPGLVNTVAAISRLHWKSVRAMATWPTFGLRVVCST